MPRCKARWMPMSFPRTREPGRCPWRTNGNSLPFSRPGNNFKFADCSARFGRPGRCMEQKKSSHRLLRQIAHRDLLRTKSSLLSRQNQTAVFFLQRLYDIKENCTQRKACFPERAQIVSGSLIGPAGSIAFELVPESRIGRRGQIDRNTLRPGDLKPKIQSG